MLSMGIAACLETHHGLKINSVGFYCGRHEFMQDTRRSRNLGKYKDDTK